MHRLKISLILAVLIFSTTVPCFTLEPAVKKTADDVIGMMINCEFTRALKQSDSLMASDSLEPLYPYLHLCALGLRDLDFDRIIDTTAFLSAYKRTIAQIDAHEKVHGKTTYSMTLRGFAYASHSSFYLLHGKYFAAIGTGMDAVRLFDDVKEMDSTNYDADFFLGFYNYARGELKKRLWMVLFWYPGSKKKGVKSLETCAQKGQISSLGSKMILIDVYVREKKYEKSKKLFKRMIEKYPASRFLFWSNARYFEVIKEYARAADEYGKLADSYEGERYGDYNALVTRLMQITLLKKAGQKEVAARIAAKTLTDNKACAKGKKYSKICRDIEKFAKD